MTCIQAVMMNILHLGVMRAGAQSLVRPSPKSCVHVNDELGYVKSQLDPATAVVHFCAQKANEV